MRRKWMAALCVASLSMAMMTGCGNGSTQECAASIADLRVANQAGILGHNGCDGCHQPPQPPPEHGAALPGQLLSNCQKDLVGQY